MRRPFTLLLLVSFSILFVGCSKSEPERSFEDFTFTDHDLQRIEQATQNSESGSATASGGTVSSSVPSLSLVAPTDAALSTLPPVDTERQRLYDNLRMSLSDAQDNAYRVNNPFLNVRSNMGVGTAQVARLSQGELVKVVDILNAEWAKVRMQNNQEGFVAFRYLAKVTTEQKLPEEKKRFAGQYFVDFSFVNIRKDPTSQSEKIGELPGQAIVKPVALNGEWARVSFNGREGYVSAQYLKPFQPVFLVRQESYNVPILLYRATDSSSIGTLTKHITALKNAGKKIATLRALHDLVIDQETKDVRWRPDMVVLVVTGVNAANIRQVSDTLQAAQVGATLFVSTKEIGLTGITEKAVLNLIANGNELQSEGHAGDDLRSLTDSQLTLELNQSKKILQDITHQEVYAVAYPTGGVNDRVMKQASAAAYLFGLSQTPDRKFDRSQFLRLPALFINSTTTPEELIKSLQ